VQKRKDAIIVKHTKGLEFLMKKHKVREVFPATDDHRAGAVWRAYGSGNGGGMAQ